MTTNEKQNGFSMWPVIFIIVLVSTALLVGYVSLSNSNNNAPQSSGVNAATLLPKPKALSPDLALTDFNNQPFTIEQLKGHWSLLFFGYTSCPDVCPTQMALLNKMLTHADIKNKPQIILVSVDPERDTPEHLKGYVQAFNPDFKGVTSSSKAEIERFSKELGVYYEYVETVKGISQDHSQHQMHKHDEKEKKSGYEVNHTASFILINPDGQYTALFTSPHVVDDMVKAYNDIAQ